MNKDSMYDFAGDYTAPQQEAETPHANRQNLSKPYKSDRQFQKNIDNAVTQPEQKSSASHEFWLMFTQQQTKNVVAMGVNHQFDRNKLSGDNFDSEKQRYVDLYNQALGL